MEAAKFHQNSSTTGPFLAQQYVGRDITESLAAEATFPDFVPYHVQVLASWDAGLSARASR
jgi:hypothetical protein